MDKKKVTDLARSFSLTCKKLAQDKPLMRTLASPTIMLISLTVINAVSVTPDKCGWFVAN